MPQTAAAPTSANETGNVYDRMPYQSYAYPATHPGRMHTIATLFGLEPQPVEKCRVLELGCASGGNILPLALDLPESDFTGIDLSGEQIRQADRHKDALKLTNICFEQADIKDLAMMSPGEPYDYIICHGVLSWVPENVRESIFKLIRNYLSPNGMAIVSYNALPGWNAVRGMREMMLYHTQQFSDPVEKIRQAIALLDFIHDNTAETNIPYREMLRAERDMLGKADSSYLFHDHLEGENRQFYLHEFVSTAAAHDLGYLGDTNLSVMYAGGLKGPARDILGAVSDLVRQEQYLDFIHNRRFRQSILIRNEMTNKINRRLQLEDIFKFYLRAPFKLDNISGDRSVADFITPGGASFNAKGRPLVELLNTLAERAPACSQAWMLVDETASKTDISDESLKSALNSHGLQLALQGLLSIETTPSRIARKVSNKPEAYALARYQAGLPGAVKITTAAYETSAIDGFVKCLLPHLDGKSDVAELAVKLMPHVTSGEIEIRQGGKAVEDTDARIRILDSQIRAALDLLATRGVLVG